MTHNKDKGENKYFIRNQETWELVEVTKKQYDSYHNAIELFSPKIEGTKGSIQILGIMSNGEEGSLKDIFYPIKYK